MAYGTSNGPQNDIGNHLGPFSTLSCHDTDAQYAIGLPGISKHKFPNNNPLGPGSQQPEREPTVSPKREVQDGGYKKTA